MRSSIDSKIPNDRVEWSKRNTCFLGQSIDLYRPCFCCLWPVCVAQRKNIVIELNMYSQRSVTMCEHVCACNVCRIDVYIKVFQQAHVSTQFFLSAPSQHDILPCSRQANNLYLYFVYSISATYICLFHISTRTNRNTNKSNNDFPHAEHITKTPSIHSIWHECEVCAKRVMYTYRMIADSMCIYLCIMWKYMRKKAKWLRSFGLLDDHDALINNNNHDDDRWISSDPCTRFFQSNQRK